MEFSLGLVEVSSLGNAIMMLDEMTKAAEVEFVAVERKLGGRLVTIVVRGSISSVNASVAAGKAAAERMNCLKAAEVIARPHHEIFKFLHLDEKEESTPNAESAATHTGKVPAEDAKKPAPKTAKRAAASTAVKKKAPAKRSKKSE